MTATLMVNGARLTADPSGAVHWQDHGALVVADLHFEKGSSFALRGQFLPPYDTAATIAGLEHLVERYRPHRVICLGDSFHDGEAAERMSATDRDRLAGLIDGRTWNWICGNHDPAPPPGLAGECSAVLTVGPLTFRHEANGIGGGEVSGHFHPKARVRVRTKRISGRCFVTDGRRLILPAFGAYTGGLDVRDPAISNLFPNGLEVHLSSGSRLYRFPGHALS